jgi:uncharacterized membrane protein (UPF0127 family)
MTSYRKPERIFVLLAVALVLASCAGAQTYPITIGGQRLLVEVVDTDETRSRGLMNRQELDEREGMLFVFPTSEPRAFWMKDTQLPLSIAYIDERWIIREILHMEPLSLEPVPSREPARYALEVNRGAFDRLGITVGDRVVLSPEIRRRIER